MIFDGRKFADEILVDLQQKIRELGRELKLAVMVDHLNEAAMKYTNLKRNMALKLGVGFREIANIEAGLSADGIIVQLPYPGSQELIQKIPLQKDVDGLRDDSPFLPAVVRAVREILKSIKAQGKIVVVGSRGFVGSRLARELNCPGLDMGDDLSKLKEADVIISCTGQPGLIKPEMVKNGFVAIDVGYPQPEFTPEALAKASWYTPVPGGVGPVTVVMLFKNLVAAPGVPAQQSVTSEEKGLTLVASQQLHRAAAADQGGKILAGPGPQEPGRRP